MIRAWLILGIAAWGLAQCPCTASPATSAIPNQPSSLTPSQSPESLGHALARKVRASFPQESTRFDAFLKTRTPKGDVRRTPIHCEIQVHDSHWTSSYHVPDSTNGPAQSFVIIHRPEGPNQYFLESKPESPDASPHPVPLTPELIGNAFAHGDFGFADLGMEFLHWPEQRLLKTEMRRSRVCHVLESRNPNPAPNQYSRVLCWLDKEHSQPLLAEAYDHQNRLLKEFSIGSLKKVQGRWQVQDMKIVNVQTRSRTWLEFDLTPAP